ncbi:MAG: hypothetical protein IKG22_01925 [Atopobiaceae bacterium]|nr:hypothetical protein [Atopobiaceae bacterium]
MKRYGIAQKAVAAGLGLAMALGTIAPAVALADSGGDTNLYIESQSSDITTPEGSADENIKVVLPVAINYVADSEGNLTGPSDNTVKIKNNTKLGSVHVSKIKTTSTSPATVVASAAQANTNDKVFLQVKPGSGTDDNFGAYLTEKAPKAGDWDVQQGGELALNSLTGKVGGFGSLDSATKTRVATVHWTVALGIAAQAAANADRFVIHLVNSDNSIPDLVTSKSTTTGSLPTGYTWKTSSGTAIANVAAAVSVAGAGASEITLYGTPSA